MHGCGQRARVAVLFLGAHVSVVHAVSKLKKQLGPPVLESWEEKKRKRAAVWSGCVPDALVCWKLMGRAMDLAVCE